MKKTVKFLTLLLALVMALQVAPIASVGVFAEEAEGDQGTVQSGETVTEESGLAVSSMEWRDASKAVSLTPLTDGMTLDCNYLLVRLTLNDIPDTAEVKVDGVSMAAKIVRKQVLVYVELLNGYHHFEFTCANASGTVTKSFFVNVEGTDSSYPVVKAENPDSIVVGTANELVITGENLDKVGKILVNVSMTPVVKVKSVDLAKGIVFITERRVLLQSPVALMVALHGNNDQLLLSAVQILFHAPTLSVGGIGIEEHIMPVKHIKHRIPAAGITDVVLG